MILNDHEKEEVRQFMNNINMSDAVYKVLLSICIKPKAYDDITMAGGYRLATDILQEVWKELKKYQQVAVEEGKSSAQVGM